MVAPRHAIIGGILLSCLIARPGAALARQADDDWEQTDNASRRVNAAPPIGTWQLTGETPAGKRFTATLVILDNADSQIEGYIRWITPGEPSAIEVFHGKTYRSGRIAFRGFEVLTQRTDVGIGKYHATYDAEKREITDGFAVPIATGMVRGYWKARYKEEAPSSLPKLMNLPQSDGNWPMLCRNLSEGFARGRIGHWHFPNAPELDELIASDDDRLLTLAQLRRGQEALGRVANDKKIDELSEEDRARVDTAIEILKELFPSDAADAGDLPPTLRQLIHQDAATIMRQPAGHEEMARRAMGSLIAKTLRERLLEAASPMMRRSEMRESDIRARCRPATEGGLVARVTNKSGKDLNRCLIVTRFSVDPQEVLNASTRPAERKLAEATIAQWLGLGKKVRRTSAQLLDYYWANESLDKGSICYLEKWPDGRTIDVDLASAPCHCIDGTTATVFVFSANGSIEVLIDEPSLQTAFGESRLKDKVAAASKPKKKAQRRRSRAPT